MGETTPVTISISRRVKPGSEEAFERALHDFVQRSLALPGQLGVHILRPAPGSDSREYGIVRKFKDREAIVAFRTSPEYLEWNLLAAEFTEGEGRVEELCGLESWFTPPAAQLRPLPKWKMAGVTLVGVYPTSLLLGETVGRWTTGWPRWQHAFIFSASMVVLLTWVVMPALTSFLHPWLRPKHSNRSNESQPSP